MTGAMYAAIGGLKTHMASLNVIGNNIANVNTAGYKSQRMTFQESLYTMSRAGSNGTLVMGGNNPSQVGYGARVGSIDLNMSPGTFNPTGLDLDCMIEGDGFFLVGDKDMKFNTGNDFTKPMLTRVGDFWQDPNGYICNRDGQVVYGFKTVMNPFYIGDLDPVDDADTIEAYEKAAKAMGVNTKDLYIVSSELVPLRLPLAAAQPTEANGGIDTASGEERWKAGDPVYDLLGGVAVDDAGNATNNNARKNYSWIDPETGEVWDYVQSGDLDDLKDNLPGGVNAADGTDDAAYIPGIDHPIPNKEGKCITIDGLKVTESGAITGTCDNGQTVVIGYVAIGKVTSPDGVTHIGGPYYKCQEGAGDIKVGAIGGIMDGRYLNNQTATAGATATDPTVDNRQTIDALSPCTGTGLRTGGLEASTADVATEFSNMILTQRGYQANTRIVSVTDSMLEELVNMKR